MRKYSQAYNISKALLYKDAFKTLLYKGLKGRKDKSRDVAKDI